MPATPADQPKRADQASLEQSTPRLFQDRARVMSVTL